MNVLYINTHDTGRHIEPYGYAVPTPNLMRLAREGVVFRQAYCAAPTCSPSRAAMLTGMSAHSCGMLGLAHRGFEIADHRRHLANHLAAQGFETVLCGIQHEVAEDREAELGYERRIPRRKDCFKGDLENAREAAAFLRGRGKGARPFFLALGLSNTHRVFPDVEEKHDPRYVTPPWPIPDNAETRRDYAAYLDSARIMDDSVGLVLDALAESGLEDDTLVLFTTDHGLPFPNMKCTLYDTGIGMALLLRAPGAAPRGVVSDAIVSQLDVYPTVCELLGLPRPPWLEGVSLRPLLDGSAQKVRNEIHAEVNFHAAYEPMRCVRTERFKYIRLFDDYLFPVGPNIDGGPSRDFVLEAGGLGRARPREMLFDLWLDPGERDNLADDPQFASTRADLAARLEAWMRRTADPLLNGPIRAPAGALVNRKDSARVEDQVLE